MKIMIISITLMFNFFNFFAHAQDQVEDLQAQDLKVTSGRKAAIHACTQQASVTALPGCLAIVKRAQFFSKAAAEICARNADTNVTIVSCLQTIANREFDADMVKACYYTSSSTVVSCLDGIGEEPTIQKTEKKGIEFAVRACGFSSAVIIESCLRTASTGSYFEESPANACATTAHPHLMTVCVQSISGRAYEDYQVQTCKEKSNGFNIASCLLSVGKIVP